MCVRAVWIGVPGLWLSTPCLWLLPMWWLPMMPTAALPCLLLLGDKTMVENKLLVVVTPACGGVA